MLISPEVKSPLRSRSATPPLGLQKNSLSCLPAGGTGVAQVLRGGALDWCQGQSPPSKRKAVPKEISGLPSPHLPGRASSR